MLRIVCLSDTHCLHRSVKVPDGDLLIHAGDMTERYGWEALQDFGAWMRELPHPHKVAIAGNHDFCCQHDPVRARRLLEGVTYLQDEQVTIEGLQIYGSPWQPWFYDWAFNLPRGEELRKVWAKIPDKTQILVTHGPPDGMLDLTGRLQSAGCEDLLARVDAIRPVMHVFGHIHEGHGRKHHHGTWFVNASICDGQYRAVNQPQVFDWDGTTLWEAT